MSYKEAELNQVGSLVVRLSLAGHKIYLVIGHHNTNKCERQVTIYKSSNSTEKLLLKTVLEL